LSLMRVCGRTVKHYNLHNSHHFQLFEHCQNSLLLTFCFLALTFRCILHIF
jgi:hypothetical protein